MTIGLLALQGDFLEHERVLASLMVNMAEVRLPKDLNGIDGLICPQRFRLPSRQLRKRNYINETAP